PRSGALRGGDARPCQPWGNAKRPVRHAVACKTGHLGTSSVSGAASVPLALRRHANMMGLATQGARYRKCSLTLPTAKAGGFSDLRGYDAGHVDDSAPRVED